jgi:outer membrane protein TolC
MKHARVLFVLFALIAGTAWAPALAQGESGTEPEPLRLSLKECVLEAFKSNKEIQVASYVPEIRQHDLLLAEAQFDPNLDSTAFYVDFTSPSAAGAGQIISREGSVANWTTTYSDPLRFGSYWQAELQLQRLTTNAINLGGQTLPPAFDETYYANLRLSWFQPLLKDFGNKVNETAIVLASKDRQIDEEDFRTRVQVMLVEVEDAYWTLVYEMQDLEVRKEALGLAKELLRLNKIRVEVGTLPPIDITQAEAGVASREEAVIIAEANIENAEDRLRRVMGLDPQDPQWTRRIVPTEDLSILERQVALDREIEKAIANRTDLASARLRLEKTDVSLAYQKDQLRYSLNFRADYVLEGLAGDSSQAGREEDVLDALSVLSDVDFPTYQATLTLGIPIGNRTAEAEYAKTRLGREQAAIAYEDYERAAIVQVGVAVRRVNTDRKRIDAAEKNRFLQEKTVEAEQKKFDNGLSTSFEVLQLQKDLAEARSAENAAKRDYRNSLANLDLVTGILEQAKGVRIDDYTRD